MQSSQYFLFFQKKLNETEQVIEEATKTNEEATESNEEAKEEALTLKRGE